VTSAESPLPERTSASQRAEVSRWSESVHTVRQHIIAMGELSLATTMMISIGATINSGATASRTHDLHLQRNLP
jgi:hypothetical protein